MKRREVDRNLWCVMIEHARDSGREWLPNRIGIMRGRIRRGDGSSVAVVLILVVALAFALGVR